MLLKAGASQSACEHALMEACLCGQARAAELLIRSEMIESSVAQHALVSASCRGYVDVADTLIKVWTEHYDKYPICLCIYIIYFCFYRMEWT